MLGTGDDPRLKERTAVSWSYHGKRYSGTLVGVRNGTRTASYRLSAVTENATILNPMEDLGYNASQHLQASSD